MGLFHWKSYRANSLNTIQRHSLCCIYYYYYSCWLVVCCFAVYLFAVYLKMLLFIGISRGSMFVALLQSHTSLLHIILYYDELNFLLCCSFVSMEFALIYCFSSSLFHSLFKYLCSYESTYITFTIPLAMSGINIYTTASVLGTVTIMLN